MNTKLVPYSVAFPLSLAVLALSGCGGQSRGNADAYENRAATPAEGGATSTAGSAGQVKNYGDTYEKKQVDGRSPSASPTGLSQDASAEHNVDTPAAGGSTGQHAVEPERSSSTAPE